MRRDRRGRFKARYRMYGLPCVFCGRKTYCKECQAVEPGMCRPFRIDVERVTKFAGCDRSAAARLLTGSVP